MSNHVSCRHRHAEDCRFIAAVLILLSLSASSHTAGKGVASLLGNNIRSYSADGLSPPLSPLSTQQIRRDDVSTRDRVVDRALR